MEVLGLGNVTPWKRMVEGLVESVLKLDKSEELWKKGCDVDEFLGKKCHWVSEVCSPPLTSS